MRLLCHPQRSGAASIEFALIAPVFFILLLGAIDYAFYFDQESAVILATQAGLREGAEAGLSGDPAGTAAAAIRSSLASQGVATNNLSLSVSWAGSGQPILAHVSVGYTPLTGVVPLPGAVEVNLSQLVSGL